MHGDLRSQIVTDMRRLYGSKLLFIEKAIVEQRRHIHVISSRGFESLVHGRSADCLTSRLWPS